jgi:hypothetical protein
MRTAKCPKESEEQAFFVGWFRARFPKVRIFAVPNGGKRHPVVANQLKAEGVESGVPDLYIPAWRVWIEMKRQKGGTVKPSQKDWLEYLESIGDTTMVCKGAKEAMETVTEFVKVRGI